MNGSDELSNAVGVLGDGGRRARRFVESTANVSLDKLKECSGLKVVDGGISWNKRFVSSLSGMSVQVIHEVLIEGSGRIRDSIYSFVRCLDREGWTKGVRILHAGTVSGSFGALDEFAGVDCLDEFDDPDPLAELEPEGVARCSRLAGRLYASKRPLAVTKNEKKIAVE